MGNPTWDVEAIKNCPKCEGFIIEDEQYVKLEDVWFVSLRCLNCGWRIEKGLFRTLFRRKRKPYAARVRGIMK
jgi:hypothetical protein